MTFSSFGTPIESNDLNGMMPLLPGAAPAERKKGLLARLRNSPFLLFGMMFAAGLLSGWLVLGLYIWQTGGLSAGGGQFDPAYERMYITWAANRYAQSANLPQAQKDLATWSRDDIARVITAMQKETIDPVTNQRVAALGDALGVSTSSAPLRASLFSQPIFLLGIFLSVTLLLAAVALIAVPVSIEREPIADALPAPVEQLDANLEELLTDVQIGTLEQETEKKEDKKEEEKKEEPKQETEESDSSSGLGDLASLFEEEDTSLSSLEAFCKGMAEVNVDELVNLGKNIVQRFKTSKPMPKTGKGR